MKKMIIAFAALGALTAPGYASDLQAHCEAYVAENGGDASGCACLADTADSDAASELMAVASEADIEALSDSAKEAIAACFPQT